MSASDLPLLQSATNFRDLGGIANVEGRCVRNGVVYRSELLSSLTPDEVQTLSGLHIGLVYDLRNPSERAAAAAAWPQSTDPVSTFILQDELLLAGADFRQLLQRMGDATFDASEVGETMLSTYRAMPAHFGSVLGRLFDTLAYQERGATLIHCTAGKDRTGFVCAMLLFALEVPVDCIMQDYLGSGRFFSASRLVTHVEHHLGHPLNPRMASAMAEMAQVQVAYLETSLAEITRAWGSVQTYLHQQAGLDSKLRERLQARLLRP